MAAARMRDDVEAPARSELNAYTGLVVVSLLATIIGLLFVFMDYNSYKEPPPAPKALQAPAPTPSAQPQPAPQQPPQQPAAAPKQKTAPD